MTQKPIWRKIKNKWVNLTELSKEKKINSIMPCSENKQINNYTRTNKKASQKQK
tara:strand:+ start:4603 stop:4764 length:162 start_codon:yes stop_codon:yes gene_type:complete